MKMKVGVSIPLSFEGIYAAPPYADHRELVEMVQFVERLGYDSAWGNEHVNVLRDVRSKHQLSCNLYEVLTMLTYAAAVTHKIILGTGNIILTVRDPILLARQAATLDVLSGGRFSLGVGMGAIRSEFEAMKPRDTNVRRGKLLEEQYEALWMLLNHEEASFKGEYVEFHDISINPKPLQKPLPLLITGEHPINAERVAKWGTGWATNNLELPKVRQLWEILLPLLERRGRDPAEIEMNTGMTVTMASTHEKAVKTLKKTLTEDEDGEAVAAKRLVGTPEEIAEKLQKLEEDGLNHLIIRQSRRDIPFSELQERIQAFAEEVLPLVS